jgi:hypothetical protein
MAIYTGDVSGAYTKQSRDSGLGATYQVAASAAGAMRALRADNSLGTGQVHFKAYNNLTPTVGTTAPDVVVKVPAGKIVDLAIPGGVNFATGIAIACVQEAGTGGTTAPAAAVSVKLGHS